MRKKALPPFKRNCPLCKKEVIHTTLKHRNRAIKLNKICHSCSTKEIWNRTGQKQKMLVNRRSYKGSGNSFFGKHHTEESKRKIIESRDKKIWKTNAFRLKMSKISSGKNNPMYGKSVYDIWVYKYGKEEADKREASKNAKLSKSSSGAGNPMYGKPAPHGSGGGWSGWYKKWFFRSLRELSYMINVIEPNKYEWETGEKLSIPYIDYLGKNRTYRPDFIVNGKIVVEIKPVKLMSTPSNTVKKSAAEEYCKKNGLEYRMVDINIVETKKLIELADLGYLVLTKKYHERLKCLLMK